MVLKEEAQTVKKCLSADFSVQLQLEWLAPFTPVKINAAQDKV